MYTVYDLRLSPYEIGRQFAKHQRYFILKEDLIHRGYGDSLEEAIDDVDTVTCSLENRYIDLLKSLYIVAEVNDLSELESLYPEYFI